MAYRPIFVPTPEGLPLVDRQDVEFKWHPGMSVIQKQKSIDSLHQAATTALGTTNFLEVSSKSPTQLGVALSAFNLGYKHKKTGHLTSVECAYQGSKVFEHGGPYSDLYQRSSREAKLDPRLLNSGELLEFRLYDDVWSLEPKSAFYDWVYLVTLKQNRQLAVEVLNFSGFTDIEFNPARSISCQAASVALYVALTQRGLLDDALRGHDEFLSVLYANGYGLGDTRDQFFQGSLT